jgi:putative ABC transport system ATP-binding protein
MIKTVDLTKVFRTEEVETTALNNVSFEIKEGEFVAIMGPQDVENQPFSTSWACLTTPTAGSIISWEPMFQITQRKQRANLRKKTSVLYSRTSTSLTSSAYMRMWNFR